MGWMAAAAQVARELVGLPRPLTLDLQPLATFDTAPAPVDRVISAMKAGLGSVGRDEAMQVAAVQRGRNEICAIATLPLRLYRGLDVIPSPLFRQFDPDVANVVHLAMTVEDLAFERVAYWQVTGQDFARFPVSVRRHAPSNVSLKRPKGAAQPGDDRFVWVRTDGGTEWQQLPASLMIRFESPNPGILNVNTRAIRRALALDQVAAMYADNPQLREWFTDADDADDPMPDEEIPGFLAEYGAARRLAPFGWLPSNVKRADVSTPSPKELTLVELQKQVTIEIANGLGVDPEDLGVSTTSRTYQNAVDRKQDKVNRVYAPYMKAITDRLSMGDVTPRGYAVQFDLTDYLKSDPVTQAAYWKALKDMGATDAAEIRGWAGLSGPPPAAPAPAPVPAPAPAAAVESGAATHAFNTAASRTFAADDFDEAPAAAAPTVDETARTITGLAVPYGAVADKYGQKYRFMPGSLEYSSPERVAHRKDHGEPVGFHRSITETAAGPVVELAVLDGPEGSRAKADRDLLLHDAAAGMYGGLSVGVIFSEDPADGDIEIDDQGVMNIRRATWRETSTTYMPAFDDARVTTVAASLTGGSMDPCVHCNGRHAPNIACATFAAQNTAPPAVTDGVALQVSGSGPTAVSPHRGGVVVTEPAPYTFDRQGNLRTGSHEFSTDLFNGWRQGGGDLAARDRANTFLREQFAVTPANVVNLNYPQNKPDMYVDQMEYQYPLLDAVSKGSLSDLTPFVVPKFNTATGLVADHVTGTEPTPGAFTATAQTITPSAVSGKVEITREAWDQGGSPQMSGLIWRQMTRGYYEALEAFVQAQMVANAASITDITITTAAADAVLDGLLSAAIVPLQYIRGGNRFRKVFTQIDLYKAMAAAKDSAGRRLYPMINPQNANGSTQGAYASIEAHGMEWLPAWATAATGTVAASSWMFDPEKVCLWYSPPQEIDLQWRVAWVDLGIWGYKAFAITDFAGTRELVYDPV